MPTKTKRFLQRFLAWIMGLYKLHLYGRFRGKPERRERASSFSFWRKSPTVHLIGWKKLSSSLLQRTPIGLCVCICVCTSVAVPLKKNIVFWLFSFFFLRDTFSIAPMLSKDQEFCIYIYIAGSHKARAEQWHSRCQLCKPR